MTQQRLSRFQEIIAFDLRSLAVFRIGLALTVIADLISRLRAVNDHYSDAGVLPRTVLIEGSSNPWYWSINLISGEGLVQVILFSLALLIALALLVGYRTRLATIATWAFIISLHNRNPALLFAADDVMRAILFWAMFLPLGACYSVDSALNSSSKPLPKQVYSGATFAFMVQLCYIYIWSAAYKTKSPTWWPDGDAVYYALSFDQYVTEFGRFLLNLPPEVLQAITWITLVFEWIGPLIIFIPFYNSFFRIVAIISFILLHIGFGLFFDIGVLSYLSVANWLTFIPSSIWDGMRQGLDTEKRRGLRIYYDADCGFCKKVVYLIRTFLILPGTPLLVAQDDASIYADMQTQNSWVVVDWQGGRHFKFEAIIYVCSLSPILRIITPILRWQPMMRLGTKFYETVASNRRIAGKFTKPLQFRPIRIEPSFAFNIFTLVLLLLITVWNYKSFIDQTVARNLEYRSLRDKIAGVAQKNDWVSFSYKLLHRKTFQSLDILSYLTRLDQSWSIFAPAPPQDDGWHVITGKLKDGTEVNVLQENKPISWKKPTLKQRRELYKTIQWRVYFINFNRSIGKPLYPYYAKYLCQKWNAKHQGKKHLESLNIYFMDERTVPQNQEQTVKKREDWQQSCSENSQQNSDK